MATAETILDQPILFAHRGARANRPENTMPAFELAVELGASGLETDAWMTADDKVVLDHDGVVRSALRLRRTPIAAVVCRDLPGHVPQFSELFARFGREVELSIDLKDHRVADAIVEHVQAADPSRLEHMWLCDPNLDTLVRLRERYPTVRLVHSVRLRNLPDTPERWAHKLASSKIDAINMREPDWELGLVMLFHKFGVAAFMWDVQQAHELAAALSMGVDAVYSDHVGRMVAAHRAQVTPPQRPD